MEQIRILMQENINLENQGLQDSAQYALNCARITELFHGTDKYNQQIN